TGYPRLTSRTSRQIEGVLINELRASGRTGPDGRVQIAGFRRGAALQLSLRHPDYLDPSPKVAVAPEEMEYVMERELSIRGRVLDDAGRPVEKGTVTVLRPPRSPGDVVGRYTTSLWLRDGSNLRLNSLRAGEVELIFGVEGYAARRVKVVLEPGQDLEDLEVQMARGARLEGRVVSTRGEPITGAAVATFPGGRPMAQADPVSATSDGQGFFMLEGLTPGPHDLEVRHSEYKSQRREVDVESAGASIRLGEIELEGPLLHIAGRVVDADGRPFEGAEVKLEGGGFHRQPATGPAEFRFGVPRDGIYRVVASAPGRAPAVRSVEVAGASVDGLELRLEAGARILGRVIDLQPSELTLVSVAATEIDSLRYASRLVRRGVAGLDGDFTIEGVPPGRWRVTARLEGRQVIASREVVIEPGETDVEVELELGDRGLPLRGQVLHKGVPAAGVQVGQFAVTDGDGRFELESVQVGDVFLYLKGPWGDYTWRAEDWSGEPLAVDVLTFGLGGRVLTPGGGPGAGLRVRVHSPGTRLSRETATDEGGRFAIDLLPAGSYLLFVEGHESQGPAMREIELDRDLIGLSIELPAAVELVIEAVRSDGASFDELQVAAFDANGDIAGVDNVSRSDQGFRARRLPRGTWQLVILGYDTVPWVREVTVPGPPVQVVLEPGSHIQVEVPALAGGQRATVEVRDAEGRPYPSLPPILGLNSTVLYGGVGRVSAVPAGRWTVRVEAADGRVFEGVVDTDGRRPALLVLE
ncbi:MAG: carboxypeptidase-like regulatory domain-containing protein, partial [Acidobacteriota bacterium]